jgi:hypothetical protein
MVQLILRSEKLVLKKVILRLEQLVLKKVIADWRREFYSCVTVTACIRVLDNVAKDGDKRLGLLVIHFNWQFQLFTIH